MHGILYEEANVFQFMMITVVIGGWTAWMAGKGVAETWGTMVNVIASTLLLGVGVRFVHHALFDGTMFALQYYVVDTIILCAFSILGFRYTRTNQMSEKYYWLYEKTGPFTWRKKSV